MTYRYRAYGLACFSNVQIAGFVSEAAAQSICPDISLELDCEPPEWVTAARTLPASTVYRKTLALDPADSTYTISRLGSEEFFAFTYGDGTEFVIEASGQKLWGRCPSPYSLDYLATYVRGPIMGFVLRRRGVIALHASAVSFFGQAIVFCGQSQSGKSTTAAALALKGIPVLCDDVAPLKISSGDFYIEPAYSHVGLWPDAVQNLLGAADALPRWTPSWEKCFLALDGKTSQFTHESQSLGAIYLLAPRSSQMHAPRIEGVGRREALLELVQNTYMNWLLDPRQRSSEFDILSRLVMQAPVRRIVPHVDAAQVPALLDLISADAEALLGVQPHDPLQASQ